MCSEETEVCLSLGSPLETCGLLGYILTKEAIDIAGDRSLRMLNHRQIIKDCAKSGKTKRSQNRGFWIGGREKRAEERWGKSAGGWGLRHRDYRYIPWDMEKTGDRNDPTFVRTLTPSTTHTQCAGGRKSHWALIHPRYSWVQCQDGEVCRARNTHLQTRFEFWR